MPSDNTDPFAGWRSAQAFQAQAQQVAARIAEFNARYRKAAELMADYNARHRAAVERMAAFSEQLNQTLAPITSKLPEWLEQASGWGEALRERLIEAYPPNWRDLTFEEVEETVGLMLDHGLSLAWVPREAVVRELLTAPDVAARDAVLVAREVEIVEDVEASLVAVELPELSPPVDALREAVATFRSGHHRASQALVAVTLGTLIHDTFGEAKFADARRRFEALDPDEVPFDEARTAAVLRCIARSLQNTDVAGPGFNRHAAAHRLSADQYTRPNAIASLMLVAALLREAAEWLTPEPEAEAA
jgi:hypothetical protein